MRLISKTHDYYDTVQSYGVDLTSTFVRKAKSYVANSNEFKKVRDLVEPDSKYGDRITWYSGDHDFRVDNYFVVFFCGQVYPMIRFVKLTDNGGSSKYYNYYDITTIGEALEKFGTEKQASYWWYNKIPRKRYSISDRYLQKSKAKEFLTLSIKESTVVDLHHELESPYFVYDQTERRLIINPSLRKLSFFKVKDPFTAYQDIDMFVGGVLGGNCPNMIEISDEIRKEKHGFDKWSFKTPPKEVK